MLVFKITNVKTIFIFLLLACSNLSAKEAKVEIIKDQVYGAPMFVKSSSLFNWRGACRDFGSSDYEYHVLEYDCGEPKCVDDGYEITCMSHAVKKVMKKPVQEKTPEI